MSTGSIGGLGHAVELQWASFEADRHSHAHHAAPSRNRWAVTRDKEKDGRVCLPFTSDLMMTREERGETRREMERPLRPLTPGSMRECEVNDDE